MSILKGMLLRFKKNVNERNIKKLKESSSSHLLH